jgi:hypothetical protein
VAAPSQDANNQSANADELDREQLEQLHAVTLHISSTCFELKKLCATVLVPAGTLVAVFTRQRLNGAVFVAGLLVIASFWVADSVSFYYGRRLRIAMDEIWQRRASRCADAKIPKAAKPVTPIQSLFHTSMLFYLVLGILVSLGFGLFSLGAIGN